MSVKKLLINVCHVQNFGKCKLRWWVEVEVEARLSIGGSRGAIFFHYHGVFRKKISQVIGWGWHPTLQRSMKMIKITELPAECNVHKQQLLLKSSIFYILLFANKKTNQVGVLLQPTPTTRATS